MTDRLPNCEAFDALLPDYLESTLDAGTCADLEAHAAGCARCGALLRELSAVTRDARALPALAPARDLWPDIAARIEAPVVELAAPGAREAGVRTARQPRWASPPWLAAAAAVLVAVTAGITYVAATRFGPGRAPMVAQNPAASVPGAAASGVRPVSGSATAPIPVQRVYDQEIARLDAIVRDKRTQLDSSTIAVIEGNLAIIDAAIAQSRAALAKDPKSRLLTDQLNNALGQKVELLRTAALLPART